MRGIGQRSEVPGARADRKVDRGKARAQVHLRGASTNLGVPLAGIAVASSESWKYLPGNVRCGRRARNLRPGRAGRAEGIRVRERGPQRNRDDELVRGALPRPVGDLKHNCNRTQVPGGSDSAYSARM